MAKKQDIRKALKASAKASQNRKSAPAPRKKDALSLLGDAGMDILTGAKIALGGLFGLTKPLGRGVKKGGKAIVAKRSLWGRLCLHCSSAGYATLIVFALGFINLTKGFAPPEDVNLWQVNRPPSLTFMDQNGNLIGTRGSHYGDPVPVSELPDYLIDSIIATEDRRFMKHHGVDVWGLLRAAIVNFQVGSWQQGGSTITQQLARNMFLTNDKTMARKLQEMQLAIWLEARLSKDDILSLYLNRTYFGAGTYGVEAASNIYFSKSARDLTLSEATLLAGLPKAPSTLSPLANFEGAVNRSREVIDNLVEADKLSQALADEAKASPPTLDLQALDSGTGYFFDYAMQEAGRILGPFDYDIVITTTLDLTTQAAAEQAIDRILNEEVQETGAEQAALVAYNNQGAIVAMVGGRSYEESQFNRATNAERQPGSAFKPFVYLAALEAGMTPRTLFMDEPISVGEWKPTNYEGRYRGPVRMTDAVARSINTVAIQITETVGRGRVIEAARRMGITHELREHPSLALGAMEVTLDEITSAYLAFGNKGKAVDGHGISSITKRTGEILYEWQPPLEVQLVDPDTAEKMNHLLFQVVNKGTGARASLGTRPAAGKTGTTNDWRDAWFIGYSSQITAGVWVGNDRNATMDKVTGGGAPAQIWREFMLAAHDEMPVLPLVGAYPAQSRDDELRLVQFYRDLQNDFAGTTAYLSPPQPERKRRRGWAIFGGN